MYPTLFWLHFSLSGQFFSWNVWKCAPRLHRKHNSEYNHKSCLIKILFFRHRNCPNWAYVGDDFRPYRSVVRPFPLLSPPSHPSCTSKNVANMCTIATGGLLGRLQWCIRHHFDDILIYPTIFWWYFDVSDIILAPCFTFRQLCFMNFLKMCSPLA